MRKIFINHKASRELVSTTYKKKTLQLKSKTNSKKKYWAKVWIDTFPKKIYKWPTNT